MTVGSLGALSDTAEQQPKLAVFMKRRSSVGPDGLPDDHLIPVKASLDQMKQQLRLGPANRAAHPRSTRKSVFKIKQGLTTAPHRLSDAGDGCPPGNSHDHDHESSPLLGAQNGSSNKKQYGANGEADSKSKGRSNQK